MLILLKLLCWAIWLIIMLYLAGSGQKSFRGFNEVKIIIDDKDDLERDVSCALSRLKKNDRLILEVRQNFLDSPGNRIKLKRTLRKNPSLAYSLANENWGC